MKVPTYKISQSGTKQRGRPKGSKDKKPRNLQRDQAIMHRRRREIQDTLDGATLPVGVSVTDLTPLQAQQIAMEQQGMQQSLNHMQQQAAQWAKQDAANTATRNELKAQTAAAAKLHGELQQQTVDLTKLRQLAAAAPPPPPPSSPMSFASTAVKFSGIRPTAAAPPPTATPPPPQPSGPTLQQAASTPRRSGRRRKATQSGAGLEPLQIAMDLAESGDKEDAKALLCRMKREKTDPLSKAIIYVEQL